MRPESCPTSTNESPTSEWSVYEFLFDRSTLEASITNPDTGFQIMALPRQDREIDGFPLHQNSFFSQELSAYLRYLHTCHIVLFVDAPEIEHVLDTDESEFEKCWDDEGTFTYHTLNIRMPLEGRILPCAGFIFIDNTLYSSMYLEVLERG
tara:strand:+ start:1846 stop:2298 length:453 start_codon:yes stop_codon:yes gene_type:complete